MQNQLTCGLWCSLFSNILTIQGVKNDNKSESFTKNKFTEKQLFLYSKYRLQTVGHRDI
jgi:hypothetical protein